MRLAFTAAILMGTTVHATAEPAPGMFGRLELTGGYNQTDTSGSDIGADGDNVLFGAVAGSLTLPVGGKTSLSLDVDYRGDDFSETQPGGYGDNAPIDTYGVGAHLMRSVGPSLDAGIFYAYGDGSRQGKSTSEQYDVHLAGVEMRAHLNDSLMAFAQLGEGFKGRDGEDAFNGFDKGLASRLGLVMALGESSSLMLDAEYSFAPDMIEGEDDGKLYGLKLSGETPLPGFQNIHATAFAAYQKFDSTTETDVIVEKQVGIGLRYYFNQKNLIETLRQGGSIGAPGLPLRASFWADELAEQPDDCGDGGETLC